MGFLKPYSYSCKTSSEIKSFPLSPPVSTVISFCIYIYIYIYEQKPSKVIFLDQLATTSVILSIFSDWSAIKTNMYVIKDSYRY